MAQIQIKELETATLYDLSNEESQALVGGAAVALFKAFSTLITQEEAFQAVNDPNATAWDPIRDQALLLWENRVNIAEAGLITAVGVLATGLPVPTALAAGGLK